MYFWLSLLVVAAAFILPMTGLGLEGFPVGVMTAFVTFAILQISTMSSEDVPVKLSEVDYATTQVGGEKTLYVNHRRGEYRTDDRVIAENISDTTQVEIVLDCTESVWFDRDCDLRVRSK